jgi:signal transduction histidine kinase
MQLQDVDQLEVAMEALTACVDADTLLTTLLLHLRHLCRTEASFVWLATEEGIARLHRSDGVPPSVTSRLQRLKVSANAERNVVGRLHRLDYRTVFATTMQGHAKILGLVATGSPRSRRSSRVDAAVFKILVRYAVSLLEGLRFSPTLAGEGTQQHTAASSQLDMQQERLRFLMALISGITHDLNNALATISGRVELLLLRLHDEVTLQHLGVIHQAVGEAGSMMRRIHTLVSGYYERGAVMVDINQLVRDSIQIAQSTWFQEFRQTHEAVDLTADLQPLPALPVQPVDLRIVVLSLLRHAMDASRPGAGLTVRTWSEGDDEGRIVAISIANDPVQSVPIVRDAGSDFPLRPLYPSGNEPALEIVQAIIHDLGGRITVSQSGSGGVATTLSLSVRRMTAIER